MVLHRNSMLVQAAPEWYARSVDEARTKVAGGLIVRVGGACRGGARSYEYMPLYWQSSEWRERHKQEQVERSPRWKLQQASGTSPPVIADSSL